MGLFNARAAAKEVAAQIEQPDMCAAELEQMVYATYQEKLDLAKQLDTAKARIESLEETLQEKTTKLRAAEEFARQSESERKSTASKIEPLEQSKKQLQANLKQENTTAALLRNTTASQSRAEAPKRRKGLQIPTKHRKTATAATRTANAAKSRKVRRWQKTLGRI